MVDFERTILKEKIVNCYLTMEISKLILFGVKSNKINIKIKTLDFDQILNKARKIVVKLLRRNY